MFRCVSLLLLLALGFLLSGVSNIQPSRRFEVPRRADQQAVPDRMRVDFEGVSFSYDTSVFGKVKSEVVPEYQLAEPDNKPDGVEPECRCFTFELGDEHRKAVLRVFPLERFPEVYAKNKESVVWMRRKMDGLRRVINDKNYRLDRQIPHLLFVDAHQDFQSKVQHFPFQNGDGVVFVMHWDIELNLISNRNLIYRYEGITTDGKFYVTAEMPVKAPFLPAEAPDEFEGFRVWDHDRYTSDALDDQKVLNYRNGISRRLEALSPNEFNPSLKHFEDLIFSLSVIKPRR